MTDKPKLGVVLSTTRDGRFADRMLNWVQARLAADGRFVPIVIDPAAYNVTLWHGDMVAQDTARLKSVLDACEAMTLMLNRLTWWCRALTAARSESPYASSAAS